ncbi:C-terminal binding protein [Aquibacillus salsiterrae]|uniref:C-terminal binding protein n=1 Tax=Aquibacillus salsiterrae TaxID=2950439 RepID=A0A9X3WCD4_9BACI|nr:C-terminal binding protein [Aquibacillus salsiterrae]MDC3416013.1 C-terminal binding protein [Aquibacillus salsiterrae]
MRKRKVYVTDWEYEDLRYEEAALKDDRIELVPVQCETEEDVIHKCKDADGLINQYAPIGRKVLEALPNLKVISRYGVGVNTIDLEAATERGICVANVPDYCVDEVSDHALALLMSWTRKVVVTNNQVKQGKWDFKVSKPIYRSRGQVLGLVGFGKIPQALAYKVQALGIKVIAYDPYYPEDKALALGVTLVSLDNLCQQADIISVHAPLMESTRGMIGKEQFSQMKPSALVINTSRGPVINEEAIIDALRKGLISGAALDVVETEPIHPDNPLLHMDNVILTPHVAWYSEEAEEEMRTKAARSTLEVLLDQQYPTYLVNPEVKDKLTLH